MSPTQNMRIAKRTRAAVRKLLGPRLTALVRRPFRHNLNTIAEYRRDLISRRGLEIGGPSALLTDTGPVPIYDVLDSLDNCLYSTNTIWTGAVGAGNTFRYHTAKPPGRQFICEATNLQLIRDSSYECLIASHCLEHVANPLRALAEWKRVLRDAGLLLLVLPHKDGTFDWRRPTTHLSHMIEDYDNDIGEMDLTHFEEVIALHDFSKDEGAGTKEEFRSRCLANHLYRAMHHHVFDTLGALTLVNHAGFQVVRVDTLKPYHIIILAATSDAPVNNRNFTTPKAALWQSSPFASDRKVTGA